MISLLLRIIVNAAAIFAAVQLLPGLHWNGTFLQLAGVALVFGVINGFLKPILSILTCPLQFLTLGLFGLVLNGLLLMLTAYLSQQLGFDFCRIGDRLGNLLAEEVAIPLTQPVNGHFERPL